MKKEKVKGEKVEEEWVKKEREKERKACIWEVYEEMMVLEMVGWARED